MLRGMAWPSSTQESSLCLQQLTRDLATLVQYELCKSQHLKKKIQGRNVPLTTARTGH